MRCSDKGCPHWVLCEKYNGVIVFGGGWDISFACQDTVSTIFFKDVLQSSTSLVEALAFISNQNISLEGHIKIAKLKKELLCAKQTIV